MTQALWYDDARRVVRISSPTGMFEAYVARAAVPARPVIVVLHEVFGVNEDMRMTCDELAASGFTALCPELFWRQQFHVDLSVTEQADWQKGLSLYNAFDIDEGVRNVEATVAAARALGDASGTVGVLGFCLGGLLVFLATARTRLDAAVAFHGARTEEFLDEVADIDVPLQMHLAGSDEFIQAEAQKRIADALAQNACCKVLTYPGCRHAFSRHGGLHFDVEAARSARAQTLAFFGRHLPAVARNHRS